MKPNTPYHIWAFLVLLAVFLFKGIDITVKLDAEHTIKNAEWPWDFFKIRNAEG